MTHPPSCITGACKGLILGLLFIIIIQLVIAALSCAQSLIGELL